MITELFYSHILNIYRGSLNEDVSGVYTSPFSDTDELEIALWARNVLGAFEKRAPVPILLQRLKRGATKLCIDKRADTVHRKRTH